MNSEDYELAAANISIQTITAEVVKHYGGQALTQKFFIKENKKLIFLNYKRNYY